MPFNIDRLLERLDEDQPIHAAEAQGGYPEDLELDLVDLLG